MKLIVLFLLSVSTYANFSGRWTASGYFESNREEGECKEVFLQIKQTKNKFMILDGGYICGDIQASYPPSQFEVVNNSLIYKDEVVGSISEDIVSIIYLDGVYKLNLKKEENQIRFRETWLEGDDYLFISSELKLL